MHGFSKHFIVSIGAILLVTGDILFIIIIIIVVVFTVIVIVIAVVMSLFEFG